jgi:hypothetical protein
MTSPALAESPLACLATLSGRFTRIIPARTLLVVLAANLLPTSLPSEIRAFVGPRLVFDAEPDPLDRVCNHRITLKFRLLDIFL